MGPTAAEWLRAAVDWLDAALAGEYGEGYSRKTYITRTADYQEGSGEPPYWNPRQ